MRRVLLVIVALVQLGAVGGLIGLHEWVLRNGRQVKLVAQPTDPGDPYRRGYVGLRFAAAKFKSSTDLRFTRHMTAYAVLALDGEGYATVAQLLHTPPTAPGVPYLEVKVINAWFNNHPVTRLPALNEEHPEGSTFVYTLRLPVAGYHLKRPADPATLDHYRELIDARGARDNPFPRWTWLRVRVWHGHAVGEQLYVQGRPVESVLTE